MINSVRCAELGEACLARKKHIITCSGAPWHAVLNPAEWWRWVALAQCEMLGETQSKTGTTRKSCPLYLLAACHGAPLQETSYCFTMRYVFVAPLSAVTRTRYIPEGNSEVLSNVSWFPNAPVRTTTPCAFNSS